MVNVITATSVGAATKRECDRTQASMENQRIQGPRRRQPKHGTPFARREMFTGRVIIRAWRTCIEHREVTEAEETVTGETE